MDEKENSIEKPPEIQESTVEPDPPKRLGDTTIAPLDETVDIRDTLFTTDAIYDEDEDEDEGEYNAENPTENFLTETSVEERKKSMRKSRQKEAQRTFRSRTAKITSKAIVSAIDNKDAVAWSVSYAALVTAWELMKQQQYLTAGLFLLGFIFTAIAKEKMIGKEVESIRQFAPKQLQKIVGTGPGPIMKLFRMSSEEIKLKFVDLSKTIIGK